MDGHISLDCFGGGQCRPVPLGVLRELLHATGYCRRGHRPTGLRLADALVRRAVHGSGFPVLPHFPASGHGLFRHSGLRQCLHSNGCASGVCGLRFAPRAAAPARAALPGSLPRPAAPGAGLRAAAGRALPLLRELVALLGHQPLRLRPRRPLRRLGQQARQARGGEGPALGLRQVVGDGGHCGGGVRLARASRLPRFDLLPSGGLQSVG
mmetsp:Transcript_44332/g.128279  ORF Transcript_44332/g.128279 Transcript_44332/m.128279 type:complete len:210 (-) Transcript_44332:12-641(-)